MGTIMGFPFVCYLDQTRNDFNSEKPTWSVNPFRPFSYINLTMAYGRFLIANGLQITISLHLIDPYFQSSVAKYSLSLRSFALHTDKVTFPFISNGCR